LINAILIVSARKRGQLPNKTKIAKMLRKNAVKFYDLLHFGSFSHYLTLFVVILSLCRFVSLLSYFYLALFGGATMQLRINEYIIIQRLDVSCLYSCQSLIKMYNLFHTFVLKHMIKGINVTNL